MSDYWMVSFFFFCRRDHEKLCVVELCPNRDKKRQKKHRYQYEKKTSYHILSLKTPLLCIVIFHWPRTISACSETASMHYGVKMENEIFKKSQGPWLLMGSIYFPWNQGAWMWAAVLCWPWHFTAAKIILTSRPLDDIQWEKNKLTDGNRGGYFVLYRVVLSL